LFDNLVSIDDITMTRCISFHKVQTFGCKKL